jgi:hypothetical protein
MDRHAKDSWKSDTVDTRVVTAQTAVKSTHWCVSFEPNVRFMATATDPCRPNLVVMVVNATVYMAAL